MNERLPGKKSFSSAETDRRFFDDYLEDLGLVEPELKEKAIAVVCGGDSDADFATHFSERMPESQIRVIELKVADREKSSDPPGRVLDEKDGMAPDHDSYDLILFNYHIGNWSENTPQLVKKLAATLNAGGELRIGPIFFKQNKNLFRDMNKMVRNELPRALYELEWQESHGTRFAAAQEPANFLILRKKFLAAGSVTATDKKAV